MCIFFIHIFIYFTWNKMATIGLNQLESSQIFNIRIKFLTWKRKSISVVIGRYDGVGKFTLKKMGDQLCWFVRTSLQCGISYFLLYRYCNLSGSSKPKTIKFIVLFILRVFDGNQKLLRENRSGLMS